VKSLSVAELFYFPRMGDTEVYKYYMISVCDRAFFIFTQILQMVQIYKITTSLPAVRRGGLFLFPAE